MMAEMMVGLMKFGVNSQIMPMILCVMMETTTKDATGMVVLAALEMIHHQIGINFAKNVNALVVVMMMMMEMMVEMMVVMTNARTSRTSAINIKRNAMRNITNSIAQRPVANVEEMMAEMMVEMMKVDVNSQI